MKLRVNAQEEVNEETNNPDYQEFGNIVINFSDSSIKYGEVTVADSPIEDIRMREFKKSINPKNNQITITEEQRASLDTLFKYGFALSIDAYGGVVLIM